MTLEDKEANHVWQLCQKVSNCGDFESGVSHQVMFKKWNWRSRKSVEHKFYQSITASQKSL